MESLLNSLLPGWPGVVFRQRPDLTLEMAGGSLSALTGRSLADWQRSPPVFWDAVHEWDAEDVRRQLARVSQTAEGLTHVFRLRHATTGRVHHLSEFRRACRDAGGELLAYEGYWLDVTRQTQAEVRLAGASWKETLGLLTLGLAHDFNNLLAGIQSLNESFLAQLPDDHPFREGLLLVKKNAWQATQLIQRLGQLHQGKTGTRSYHNLNDLVKQGAELLSKVVPRRITVTEELEANPLPLYVDAVEFQQVLIGLALNATEAMPERGQLRLRTSQHASWPEPEHRVGFVPRLPAVRLAVEDTGGGIKPRLLSLLFDPFFTTKPLNRGSGLGLYNARLFAEKHEGAIAVESREGVGSTFSVWLPLADFTEADQALDHSRQRRRGLLLVGSDGPLRQSTADWLRQQGYTVVVAGEDAEELLRCSDYIFDGVWILAEPKDSRPAALARFVRLHRLPLRLLVQAAGTNAEELPAELTRHADLLLPADLPPELVLARVTEVLLRPGI